MLGLEVVNSLFPTLRPILKTAVESKLKHKKKIMTINRKKLCFCKCCKMSLVDAQEHYHTIEVTLQKEKSQKGDSRNMTTK